MRPATLLTAVLVTVVATAVVAQEPKTDIYLMQIATAVSGASGGSPVWVVICGDTAGTYDVVGTFKTVQEAQQKLNTERQAGKNCAIEGPYTAGPVYADAVARYGTGCKKLADTDCVSDSAFVFRVTDLDSVTLTYKLRNGTRIVEPIRTDQVEAIFFTMPSIDRMLVPYYVRTRGINYALNKRREFLRIFRARDYLPAQR